MIKVDTAIQVLVELEAGILSIQQFFQLPENWKVFACLTLKNGIFSKLI